MNAKELLVRAEVHVSDAEVFLKEARLSLAQQAKSLLQYGFLHDQLNGEKSSLVSAKASAEKAVAAFQEVGIQPFSPDSVEEYKRVKLAEMKLKYWFRNFANSDIGENTMFCGGVTSIVTFLLSLIIAACLGDAHKDHAARLVVTFAMPVVATSLLLWLGLALGRKLTDRNRKRFDWMSNPLGNFPQLVPDFALAHAVALKQTIPEATFSVEWLRDQDIYHPPLNADPFLVMYLGSNQYYIDVWDEKDFEGRK